MALRQFDITSFISTDELSYFLGFMNFLDLRIVHTKCLWLYIITTYY